MRERQQLFTLVAILTMALGLFVNSVLADEWFDSYGKLSRDDERARLANLADFLREHREMVGYIAFCIGPGDRSLEVKAQKAEGVNFVASMFKIPKSRFRIVDSGRCSETTTILQPIDKSRPAPHFF